VLFGPARKTLILSTDNIKVAYADGEVQPIAGTFPKPFAQKRRGLIVFLTLICKGSYPNIYHKRISSYSQHAKLN
jgi:hypothetical protein